MEVKVRDLSASRDRWKERALKAEQEQRQLQKELENLKKKGVQKSNEGNQLWKPTTDAQMAGLKPKGHHYPVGIIQLAIQLIIQSLTSLRGVEKTLKLLSNWWQVPQPDFSSIRQWELRLGLYELTRKKDYRSGLDIYSRSNIGIRPK